MAVELPGHYQALATANAAGTGVALINEDANFVTVTSSSSGLFITLPTGYIGMILRGYVGANGFKLRTITSSSTNINNVDTTGGTVGAAIPATSEWQAQKVTATNWVLSSRTNAGVAGATITPA